MQHGRQRHRSWRRHAFRLVALVIIGLAIGTAVALSNFDKDMYDRLVADRVEEALGRRLDIDGELTVSLSLEPEITATDVRLENPDWSDGEDVFKVNRVDAKIALLPLLVGKLTMLRLAMDQVDADLEVSTDGQANWNLETAGDTSAGGSSLSLDLPDQTTINRLNFTYTDHIKGNKYQGYFDAVQIASSQTDFDITTTGQVSDTPVTVDLNLPSLEAIVDPDLTTPVRGTVSALGVDVAIDGTVGLTDKGEPTGSAKVSVDSNDISNFAALTGLDLPGEPFHFDGTAELDKNVISAKGTANVASTSATIDTSIDTSTEPYSVTGTASISGNDPTWIAKLAAVSLPAVPYTLDTSFTLAGKLQAQGNATLGDLKAQFTVADASWDGIPPQSLTLALDGPDMSKLGDWLEMRLPAIPFQLQMNGTEVGSKFNITDAVVTSNQTKVEFDASLADLSDPLSQPIGLRLQTDNIAAVGNLYDLDLPDLAFQISTNLAVDDDNYTLSGLKFTIGQQNLAGSLSIDDSKDRLIIAGTLATDELDVATVTEAMSSQNAAEDEPLVIPDPGINLDVQLTATTVTFDDARLENVDLRLRTDDKHVGLYGLTAVFGGGQLVSDFTIAHGVQNPPIDGTLELTNASTTDLSTMFDLPGDVRGPLNIDIVADSDITASNQTLKDVTGHADVVLQDGYVGSDVLREADSFVNLLAPWRNKKDPSQVNCLVLRYDLADGRATSEVTLLDTTTMTVAGTGYVDLIDETINLRLVPTPKDANLLSLATAVRVKGPIDDPSLSSGPLDIATGTAGSLLGSLLSPIKMLLPILGLGPDDDQVCQAALDPDRGASNAAQTTGASQCARPQPWTDNGNPRLGRHKQHGLTC
jgi:uncharacterized protein involved in outer membrane biogenesis